MSLQTWTIQDVERTTDALRVKVIAPKPATEVSA